MNASGSIGVIPSGNVKSLIVLVDDIYQVEHVFQTPKNIIRRLRDHRQFQGARYEILAGSIFARCSFKIDYIDDKTQKTPEFFASKEETKEDIAVEAKSRHRKGVIHESAGEEASVEETPKAGVGRLFR